MVQSVMGHSRWIRTILYHLKSLFRFSSRSGMLQNNEGVQFGRYWICKSSNRSGSGLQNPRLSSVIVKIALFLWASSQTNKKWKKKINLALYIVEWGSRKPRKSSCTFSLLHCMDRYLWHTSESRLWFYPLLYIRAMSTVETQLKG